MANLVVVKTLGIELGCSGSSFVVLYRVVVVEVLVVRLMGRRLASSVGPTVVFLEAALKLAGARMRNLAKVVVDSGSLVLVRDQAGDRLLVLTLILVPAPLLILVLCLAQTLPPVLPPLRALAPGQLQLAKVT